jgi:intracellular septation protein A
MTAFDPAADAAPDDLELDAPPTFRSVIQRYGRRALTDSIIPLVLFIAVNTAFGLAWAMVVGTAWSGGLMAWRRSRGQSAGALVWFSLGFVLLRGVAGVLTRSDAVYFGPGIVNNFVIAAAFAVSVVVRRPIVGYIAPVFYRFPDVVQKHPTYTKVFGRLTLAWALLQLATGLFQVWLIVNASTNTYVLLRTVTSLPLMIALFAISLRYPRRAFARDPELAPWAAAAEQRRSGIAPDVTPAVAPAD